MFFYAADFCRTSYPVVDLSVTQSCQVGFGRYNLLVMVFECFLHFLGIWAVINTNGICYRGRLDQQDIAHWDAMMKTNVLGLLRVARTFQELLRSKTHPGRIVTFGIPDFPYESGLVAYLATKYAVEGATISLEKEMQPLGIRTVILQTQGIPVDLLYASPKIVKR